MQWHSALSWSPVLMQGLWSTQAPPVSAHANNIFLFLKGLCLTRNPVYCLLLFYSGTAAQSLLSHLSALQLNLSGEISLSIEEQPKEDLEKHSKAHSQLGLENQAAGLKNFFPPRFPVFPGFFEPKMIKGWVNSSCQILIILRVEG